MHYLCAIEAVELYWWFCLNIKKVNCDISGHVFRACLLCEYDSDTELILSSLFNSIKTELYF